MSSFALLVHRVSVWGALSLTCIACNSIFDIETPTHSGSGGGAGNSAGASGGGGLPTSGGSGGSAAGGDSGGSAAGGDSGASAAGGDSGGGSDNGEAGDGGSAGAAGAASGPVCGDGVVDATEKCDDANALGDDGCSSSCRIEPGWSCDGGEPTHCTSTCGDGLVVGAEARAGGCDDGNTVAGDGCLGCKVEASYFCSDAPSVCAKTCGNGKLDGGEGCDDANPNVGDGCFACAVETGFTCNTSLVPSQCTDVDECTNATNNCSTNAVCTNKVGSFSCACKMGYSGNGVTCADVNECTNATNNCSTNAVCTNTPGSFSCACKMGYSGNGVTCADVNECTNGMSNCSANAVCANTVGSFACICRAGYAGNGVTCGPQPSCSGLAANCGGTDNCCASSPVTGGSFKLGGASGTPATIATFVLDKYEVTVGRFRNFVNAYNGPPANGAGMHPLIAGSGWQTTWNSVLPADKAALLASVQCGTSQTYSATGHDSLPINCVDWYQAFAFCAWDGGRLPTDAEWEYAAAGGSAQRPYPWGNTPVPNNMQDTAAYATYDCLGDGSAGGVCADTADMLSVGSKPLGAGKYGQLDLVGSMAEWELDWYSPSYQNPCDNCANLTQPAGASDRVVRGGAWFDTAQVVSTTQHGNLAHVQDNVIYVAYGFRCARTP